MAACGSLQHIFDNPLPENPSSLIDSLSSSWKQIKPLKPHVDHSFTEIFGELHFKETSDLLSPFSSASSSSSPAFPIDSITQGKDSSLQEDNKWVPVSPFSSNGYTGSYHKRSESFSSMNSESLQLCTEGLGFESLDNVEDLKFEFQDTSQNQNNNSNNDNNSNDNQSDSNISSYNMREKVYVRGHSYCQYSKGKTNGRPFPPPISCIGRTGKPWVCFQSYRQDGRFVLKEIRIPTQEFLHACREDGRLRLCFVQPSEDDNDDDIIEEDDAGEEEEGDGEMGVVGKIDEVDDEEREEGDDGVKEEGGDKEEEAEIRDDFERGHS